MTHEPENPERDPALESAWREHSTEEPSPQLDAAILAAAHRAVGSGPQGAGKQAAEAGKAARAATGPQRWWMPLAAAATIGAVALGILQTMPQQELTSSPAASDTTPPAASDTTPPAASDTPARAPERANAAPPASSPASELSATVDELQAPKRKQAPAAVTEPVAPPPGFAKPAVNAVAPAATDKVTPQPPMSAAPAPQPFPAEKKVESGESDLKDQARMASKLATAPEVAPAPPAAAAPMQESARADARQRNEAMPSAPAAAGAIALGKTAARMDAAAAPAVDVDAAIARIRKLHDEGKLADAAKELVALRAVVPDADARLPRELRAWAATVKP